MVMYALSHIKHLCGMKFGVKIIRRGIGRSGGGHVSRTVISGENTNCRLIPRYAHRCPLLYQAVYRREGRAAHEGPRHPPAGVSARSHCSHDPLPVQLLHPGRAAAALAFSPLASFSFCSDASMKAGMSAGFRLDTRFPSTTTSWSTNSAPAFLMSWMMDL